MIDPRSLLSNRILGSGPTQALPPWELDGALPPGIMLAPKVPESFMPYASTPRPPGAPPYERLLLISSRVHDTMRVRGDDDGAWYDGTSTCCT